MLASNQINKLKKIYERWEERHLYRVPAAPENYQCGIDVDNKGRIFAVSAPDELHILLPNGDCLTTIKTFGGTPFNTVTKVELDQKEENLFVMDQRNNRIVVFSTDDFTEKNIFELPAPFSIKNRVTGMKDWNGNSLVVTTLEENRSVLYYLDENMEIKSRSETNHFSPHLSENFFPLSVNHDLFFLFISENAVYRLSGNKMTKIFQNQYGSCHDFATDNTHIYICQNFGIYKILKIDLKGNLVYALPYPSLKMPVSLSLKYNRLYISDRATNEIRVLEKVDNP